VEWLPSPLGDTTSLRASRDHQSRRELGDRYRPDHAKVREVSSRRGTEWRTPLRHPDSPGKKVGETLQAGGRARRRAIRVKPPRDRRQELLRQVFEFLSKDYWKGDQSPEKSSLGQLSLQNICSLMHRVRVRTVRPYLRARLESDLRT